jgi:hypothetical protein
MHGVKRRFPLGNGLQSHDSYISVDIDSSSVLFVMIQDTRPNSRWHWNSTEDSSDITGAAAPLDRFMAKSYAISPNHLPQISDLDKWGRRDIMGQAEKWPNDLEATYDKFFLRYCQVTPQLPCVRIQRRQYSYR